MPDLRTGSLVLSHPAAVPEVALEHFSSLLSLETDCWDVHDDLVGNRASFLLLDVRSPEAFAAGHLPQAVSLPYGRIIERNLLQFPDDATFVVYCAGPHCNATEKAAVRLARLSRPVKKMVGGVCGWEDENFELVR